MSSSARPRLLARLGVARVLMLFLAVVVVLMVVFPGLFTPYNPAAVGPSAILQPPSWALAPRLPRRVRFSALARFFPLSSM